MLYCSTFSIGCRRPLQTFWAITHVPYGTTIDAVTLSMFVMFTPVKSRDRGQHDEAKKCWYLQNEKS